MGSPCQVVVQKQHSLPKKQAKMADF